MFLLFSFPDFFFWSFRVFQFSLFILYLFCDFFLSLFRCCFISLGLKCFISCFQVIFHSLRIFNILSPCFIHVISSVLYCIPLSPYCFLSLSSSHSSFPLPLLFTHFVLFTLFYSSIFLSANFAPLFTPLSPSATLPPLP